MKRIKTFVGEGKLGESLASTPRLEEMAKGNSLITKVIIAKKTQEHENR